MVVGDDREADEGGRSSSGENREDASTLAQIARIQIEPRDEIN